MCAKRNCWAPKPARSFVAEELDRTEARALEVNARCIVREEGIERQVKVQLQGIRREVEIEEGNGNGDGLFIKQQDGIVPSEPKNSGDQIEAPRNPLTSADLSARDIRSTTTSRLSLLELASSADKMSDILGI